jgi:hypothetical protein
MTEDFQESNYVNINSNINLFDIVIPVGPNDKSILSKQIEFTKKNIIGHRNIYLICNDPTIIIDGCITIDENIFPFSIDTVRNIFGEVSINGFCKNGWYLQQLLKLYSLLVIPGILERCLILDCDTFFLKPTIFIKNNKCLYNYGTEYVIPYFVHMYKMDNNLIKVNDMSGICHHMMFEKKYIIELMNKIETNHNDIFYNIFLKMVTVLQCGASEYEIYFNYMFKNHSDKVEIRELKWANTGTLDVNANYDYISYHYYMRS